MFTPTPVCFGTGTFPPHKGVGKFWRSFLRLRDFQVLQSIGRRNRLCTHSQWRACTWEGALLSPIRVALPAAMYCVNPVRVDSLVTGSGCVQWHSMGCTVQCTIVIAHIQLLFKHLDEWWFKEGMISQEMAGPERCRRGCRRRWCHQGGCRSIFRPWALASRRHRLGTEWTASGGRCALGCRTPWTDPEFHNQPCQLPHGRKVVCQFHVLSEQMFTINERPNLIEYVSAESEMRNLITRRVMQTMISQAGACMNFWAETGSSDQMSVECRHVADDALLTLQHLNTILQSADCLDAKWCKN